MRIAGHHPHPKTKKKGNKGHRISKTINRGREGMLFVIGGKNDSCSGSFEQEC